MTEDQYKTIVRGRLEKDDFVAGDGVSGYMDNGMDDFGDDDEIAESDEEIKMKKKCMCHSIFCFVVFCS